MRSSVNFFLLITSFRSPAFDAFRKVSRGVFQKLGITSRRTDIVHDISPAKQIDGKLITRTFHILYFIAWQLSKISDSFFSFPI